MSDPQASHPPGPGVSSPISALLARPPTVRRVQAAEAIGFAAEVLLAPQRRLPVVAVTTGSGGQPHLDPERLAAALGSHAQVVLLETGKTTWTLTSALPRDLEVYAGAVRVWWPGLSQRSNPADHPRFLLRGSDDPEEVFVRLVDGITAGCTALRRPPPDPWLRIAQEYAVGDVVRARVAPLHQDKGYVLVELLPGARAIVPMAEIDATYIDKPADVVEGGQPVLVKILSLDLAARKCSASIKQAYGASPRPAIALVPGDEPFLADLPDRPARTGSCTDASGELSALRRELDATGRERHALARQLRAANDQTADLKKQLRSARDRLQALEQRLSGDLDPLSSENAFLTAVRVEHARRFEEADRMRYPLERMRVGGGFLATVRGLQGIDVAKTVEVCAQVACGRARELAGRGVHEIRSGSYGSPGVTRDADGAKAYRCSLPSAHRLHWWMVPGDGGHTIEFASVGVHDDFSIPGQPHDGPPA